MTRGGHGQTSQLIRVHSTIMQLYSYHDIVYNVCMHVHVAAMSIVFPRAVPWRW
jgi:hypothetical protein